MIKNIIVRSEIGEVTGMTYPKRAKGLVKHGRAVLKFTSAISKAIKDSEASDENIMAGDADNECD